MPLVERFDVRQRHVDIQIVRARGDDVLADTRRFTGHGRIDIGVEEHRLQPGQQLIERFARLQRKTRAVAMREVSGGRESGRRTGQDEFSRGQVVVAAAVDPEKLGVALDLLERRRIDVIPVGHDRFEHVPHFETVGVALVVEDVAAGDGRLRQVPDQRLLAQ